MPIEIRELNIKVTVSQNQQEQDSSPPAGTPENSVPDKEEFVDEIMEQVVELLKSSKLKKSNIDR